VNNVAFEDPPVPVLLQILSRTSSAQKLVPAGSIYTLKRGDVVEVTIPAGAAAGPVSPQPNILVLCVTSC
jgi:iron transport multicopper oxidase